MSKQKNYKYSYNVTVSINKEEAKERSLKYYYDNKKELNKKIACACLGRYSYKNKWSHLRTKIHQDYLKKLKNNDESDSE